MSRCKQVIKSKLDMTSLSKRTALYCRDTDTAELFIVAMGLLRMLDHDRYEELIPETVDIKFLLDALVYKKN